MIESADVVEDLKSAKKGRKSSWLMSSMISKKDKSNNEDDSIQRSQSEFNELMQSEIIAGDNSNKRTKRTFLGFGKKKQGNNVDIINRNQSVIEGMETIKEEDTKSNAEL